MVTETGTGSWKFVFSNENEATFNLLYFAFAWKRRQGPKMISLRAVIAIFLVFIACCSNVYFLEHLIRYASGSGTIITFFQFLATSAQGFVFTADFGRKAPVVPIRKYFVMVVLFFFVQVTNNAALNFKIPMPLHMIFRSGSLMANLVLGIIILKRSYAKSKYIGVIMITVGIIMCTLVSVTGEEIDSGNSFMDYIWWAVGITLLVTALFLSARLGIMQEEIALEFGKHPDESLFYSHALPLPCFFFLAGDIYRHAILFSQSELYMIPIINKELPIMWLYLIGNLITQYICIRSVYVLTVEFQSLTVTLVITLRKFFSLIISIIYFRNPFTMYHWIGTALVFSGMLLFVDILGLISQTTKPKEFETVKRKSE